MRPADQYDAASAFENANHRKTLKRLFFHIWGDAEPGFRKRLIFSITCLVLAKVLSALVPVVYKMLIDGLDQTPALATIPIAWIVAYGLARIGQSLFGELRDYLFIDISQAVRRKVALETFEHLHRLSLRFHLDRQTGGLSRVIERGVAAIRFVLSFVIFNIGPTLVELGIVIVLLSLLLNVWFGVVLGSTVILYIWLTVALTEWRLKFRRQMNQQDTKANSKAVDSLLNFETVKYFGNEQYEADRYRSSLVDFEKAAVKSQTSLSKLNVGQQGIIVLGTVLVLIMAAQGVVEKTMTIGDFVMVNTYMLQLFIPLNFLGFVYREIKQGLIDMDKMFELIAVKEEILDPPSGALLEVSAGQVRFDGVGFHYQPNRVILKNICLEVPPGTTCAIVGTTGSGKSTLVRLLLRFYDVANGAITIDGQNIKDVTQQSLRQAISIVPQDTVLFNDTIGYNIRYGAVHKTHEDCVEAAKAANIHAFIIGLPDGYDTMVGERGLKLSGGEKQRVAIARAILKGSKILIFDEATSSLDSHTERAIQEELETLAKSRTTLVIAHRLSTVVNAEKIVVLEEGAIVEQGNHDELMARQGAYFQLWNRQQQDQVNPDDNSESD